MGLPPPGTIRVGFTEKHGMSAELSQHPPPGVQYSFLQPLRPSAFLQSPIKGYMGHYETGEEDLIEAVLSPVRTRSSWVYSCENFVAAAAFNLLGCPVPRSLRVAYIKHLLMKDNCKKVMFWSLAGQRTLQSYGGIDDERLLNKVTVVYPAIRTVPDNLIRLGHHDVSLLFSGDFFRKGGVNVVDAFERAQTLFPSLTLTVCCDETIDFNTPNAALRSEYLDKLKRNRRIIMRGRVTRHEFVENILPTTDIYLLPAYVEAFGFAILEAMAFGVPVISTNYFAIPEMIEHGISGFLIDTSGFDCDRMFRGYVVDDIPAGFRSHVTETLFGYLRQLIESAELRQTFGMAGLALVRKKFSFETRNRMMLDIYREAVQS